MITILGLGNNNKLELDAEPLELGKSRIIIFPGSIKQIKHIAWRDVKVTLSIKISASTCGLCDQEITNSTTWLVSKTGYATNMLEPTQVCQIDMSCLPNKQIDQICSRCTEAHKITL